MPFACTLNLDSLYYNKHHKNQDETPKRSTVVTVSIIKLSTAEIFSSTLVQWPMQWGQKEE